MPLCVSFHEQERPTPGLQPRVSAGSEGTGTLGSKMLPSSLCKGLPWGTRHRWRCSREGQLPLIFTCKQAPHPESLLPVEETSSASSDLRFPDG